VILAGGDGTRLQPLTRLACGDNRPKQFCPLLGGKTLLASTQQRIARSIDSNQILLVLTKKHEPFYREELKKVPRRQKIVQPYNQGTLPAILWSLLRLYHADQRALVAFFPSDHHFAHENEFISTVEKTFDYVDERSNSVVLLGAVAQRPETQYGWIEPEHGPGSGLESQFARVRRFWEKPPLEIAIKLLSQGCLWNTFVMVGSVDAFLTEHRII
jgi:mannose-1-phosphate guanylyltransferase